MGVRGRHDVGPGCVNLRMDCEGGRIQRPGALDDVATGIDQEQVLHPDQFEVHTERVDPEVVAPLRVPDRDVAGQSLVEPEVSEQPEGGGEALLPVSALVLDVVEPGEAGRAPVRAHPDLSCQYRQESVRGAAR